MMAATAGAQDIQDKIDTWESMNGHTGTTYEVRFNAEKTDVLGVKIEGVDSATAVAQIRAVSQAHVDAWREGKKSETANVDKWSPREKAMARIAFNQENRIRKLELKQPIRWEEFKALIEQEL